MVPIMNELRVEAAVFGNHEFDFGIGPLRAAMEKMNFPWLCSNLKTHDGWGLASVILNLEYLGTR